MVKIFLFVLLATGILSENIFAATDSLTPSAIRYRLDLKDGADCITLMDKTPWFGELQKTNLYRGLMIRLGGLVGALPSKEKTSWEGKLADFILQKALSGRSVSAWYFQAPTLVTPLAFSIRDLGNVEKQILSKIVEATRTAPNRPIVFNALTGQVIPIEINTQKLAVSFSGHCFAISRDPSLAWASAESCRTTTASKSDLSVKVNLSSLSSSTSEAVKKYLGFESWLSVDFQKRSDGSFAIANAQVPLKKNHVMRDSKISSELLQMLPADTFFYSTFSIPRPKLFRVDEVKKILAGAEIVKDQMLATFFYLGMEGEKNEISRVGVLLSQNAQKIPLADLTKLFQNYYTQEVYMREVCKNTAIAISPQQDVIDAIDSACANKIPNLSHASSEMVKAMGDTVAANTMMVNLGRLLKTALNQGLTLDSATDKEKSAEVTEAQNLLTKLPAIFLNGSAGGEEMTYKAYYGVF